MTTLRSFILEQSALSTGHTIREHIANPIVSNKTVYMEILEVEHMPEDLEISISSDALEIEITSDSTEIELDTSNTDVEIEID